MGMGLSPVPLALVKSLVPSNIIGHGKVPETLLKYMAHGIYPYTAECYSAMRNANSACTEYSGG